MQSSGPNPVVYVIPALALAVVVLYYLYGAADRFGLETHQADARVTGKQHTPGTTSYNTNIVAGRAWTQSTQTPDMYIVQLDLNGVETLGAVPPDVYASLQAGERVRVAFQRTRFTQRILVTDVRR